MPRYLLEVYAPATAGLADVARPMRAAAQASRDIRYVRSIFLPEDETCFHIVEAASAEAVRNAGRAAGISFPRVIEALSLEPTE